MCGGALSYEKCLSIFFLNRRKINYKQFKEALKMLAEKKYPGDEEALKKLETLITEAKGPVASGVTVRMHIYNAFVS